MALAPATGSSLERKLLGCAVRRHDSHEGNHHQEEPHTPTCPERHRLPTTRTPLSDGRVTRGTQGWSPSAGCPGGKRRVQPRSEPHAGALSALLLTCSPPSVHGEAPRERVPLAGSHSPAWSGADITKVSVACVPVPQGKPWASHRARSVL